MSFALTLGFSHKVDVLVVEGNRFMRAAMTRILQRQGRRCMAVGSVSEAKMTLREHHPSCVLADFSFEDRESGVDLLLWMRTQPGLEAVPCGLMSSGDRREVSQALLAAGLGALPVLTKPFALGELEAWIDRLLPRARPGRAQRVP
jgi:DNA-binding response OmpR family regulator